MTSHPSHAAQQCIARSVARYVLAFLFFFFFQAEDGIRDKLVTGVQTCALPISSAPPDGEHPASTRRGGTYPRRGARGWRVEGVAQPPARATPDADDGRARR